MSLPNGSPAKKPSQGSYVPRHRVDRNSIGKTVRKLREAQGLTTSKLAVYAQVEGWDISRFSIRKIEIGEREVTDIELRMLAKALKVPIGVLFD
jgi:transcriptional regulator with XRE-family HTH domain